MRNAWQKHPTPATIEGMSRVERTKASQLDDVSKAIIEQLQLDGRRSYSEIGKKVGLSEAAVPHRRPE